MEPVHLNASVSLSLLSSQNPFYLRDEASFIESAQILAKELVIMNQSIGGGKKLSLLNSNKDVPINWDVALRLKERFQGMCLLSQFDEKGGALLEKIALETIDYLKEGRLDMFDALVGDQACQDRAMILINWITEKGLMGFDGLEKLIKSGSPIPYSFLLIVLMRLLTITKKENKTDSVNIQDRTDITPLLKDLKKKDAENLVKKAQKTLAAESVREVALSNFRIKKTYITTDQVKYDAGDRACLPCYGTVKTNFNDAKKRGIPIVIRAFRCSKDMTSVLETQHFKFEVVNGKYVHKPELAKDQPAYYLEGYSTGDSLDPIKGLDVLKFIYKSGAHHSQYPMKEVKDDPYSNDPKKMQRDKEAEAMGITDANSSLFVLKHIAARSLKQMGFA